MKQIIEGSAKIFVPKEKKISRKLSVFYNPIMKLNRDVSVLLLNSIPNKKMQIALPLAGTGIRGIRFLLELKKDKIKNIFFNDHSENAVKLIKRNLRLNKLKAEVFNKDANMFLLQGLGFDYIDIDPFGSPNFLLDSASKRLARNGILATTATDTSALSGTFPSACKRKYWAKPLRNEIMHEIGLRILIRKAQLIAAQYDKALVPIFSYAKDHYMRTFLKCEKGKTRVDKIIKQHGLFSDAGPMWLGNLWDKKLTNKISKNTDMAILKTIAEESKIDVVGFYNIHKLCKKHKIKTIPKKSLIIKNIRKAGYKASPTNFDAEGIRTNMPENRLTTILNPKL